MIHPLNVLVLVSLLFFGDIWFVTPPVSASTRVDSQALQIRQRGSPNDTVRLLVSLVRTPGARQPVSPFGLQLRMQSVRRLQSSFVGRHRDRFVVHPQQPTLVPIVIGEMRRQDVIMLANDADVISIEEDQFMPVLVQRSTALIGATSAHASGFDGTGMSIAVLDTGVLSTHEFLAGKVVAEACFSNYYGYETSLCPSGTNTPIDMVNDVGSAQPCTGIPNCDHGTHVAGIAAGKVTPARRGVAPGANLIAVQVFTYSAGSLGTYTGNQVMAMDWLLMHINTPEWGMLAAINMSLGSGLYTSACDDTSTLTPYINEFRALGVATVIATGNNSNSGAIARPACVSSAIAVGSSTSGSIVRTEDEVSSFSNSVPASLNGANSNGDRLIDLLAPGEVIYSSVSSSISAYDYKQGTSMAAPHVAGAWAVMRQLAPDASVGQTLSWLYRSGEYLIDSRNSLSLPRISIARAIRLATTALNATATFTPVPSATNTPTSTPSMTPTWTHTPLPSATRQHTATTVIHTATATLRATRTPTPQRPAAFSKRSPSNLSQFHMRPVTLAWQASRFAVRYEYCITTAGSACTTWKNAGAARSVIVYGLKANTTYVWQVRARNASGATLATNSHWRFHTR